MHILLPSFAVLQTCKKQSCARLSYKENAEMEKIVRLLMEMLTSGSPQGFTRHRCAISMSVGIARRAIVATMLMVMQIFAQ